LDAAVGQQIDAVLGVDVFGDLKAEVELPCRDARWRIAIFVEECQADLDDLEEVDVAAQQLVLVRLGRVELAQRFGDDSWGSKDKLN
jgi:hypothetical protein